METKNKEKFIEYLREQKEVVLKYKEDNKDNKLLFDLFDAYDFNLTERIVFTQIYSEDEFNKEIKKQLKKT